MNSNFLRQRCLTRRTRKLKFIFWALLMKGWVFGKEKQVAHPASRNLINLLSLSNCSRIADEVFGHVFFWLGKTRPEKMVLFSSFSFSNLRLVEIGKDMMGNHVAVDSDCGELSPLRFEEVGLCKLFLCFKPLPHIARMSLEDSFTLWILRHQKQLSEQREWIFQKPNALFLSLNS